jgi:hypothetical protein
LRSTDKSQLRRATRPDLRSQASVGEQRIGDDARAMIVRGDGLSRIGRLGITA